MGKSCDFGAVCTVIKLETWKRCLGKRWSVRWAVDGLPVDLVWAQLSPPSAGAEHLKALARVSRRLRDRSFLAKLRGAGSPDALYALFTQGAALDAA